MKIETNELIDNSDYLQLTGSTQSLFYNLYYNDDV